MEESWRPVLPILFMSRAEPEGITDCSNIAGPSWGVPDLTPES